MPATFVQELVPWGREQWSMVRATFVQSELAPRGRVQWRMALETVVQSKLVPWGRVQWRRVLATFEQSELVPWGHEREAACRHPAPPPGEGKGRELLENVREMFGNVRNCSELVGAPPTLLPRVGVPPRLFWKCSEIF